VAHKYSYTFRVNKGRLLQYKHNVLISRIHSFAKSKNSTQTPIATFNTLVASANYDGTIVVVDIFSRRKQVIHSGLRHIQSISFLNKNWLLSTTNSSACTHNLNTLRSKDIHSKSILEFLQNRQAPTLELLDKTVLEPLVANKLFGQAFDLVLNNPLLKESLGYDKLDYIYQFALSKAVEALEKENPEKAHLFLEKFENSESKKMQISALFQDFKQYDRFKHHIEEKKYAIAYAICSKHTSLLLTQVYEKMEAIYQQSFQLAQSQMQLNQKDAAKQTLSDYLTVLSKRDTIKNLLDETLTQSKIERDRAKLLLLYEKNSFKECYELIDESSIKDLELVTLLEKHWIKLMLQCEEFALSGNIKEIKKSLGELISTQTRVDKVGDILRVAFYAKIEALLKEKNFNSAQNIIYSYIDIFGEDLEMKAIMREFENNSSEKLAITQNKANRESRNYWLNSELIVEY